MFSWDAEKIRFLRDASEHTPFNDLLAERAAAFFPKSAHVCDAGCGLGYLSLALSQRCTRVTAIDTSPEALAVLLESIETRGVENISVMQADVFSLPESARFDGMAFCFFGGTGEILRCAKVHCLGKVVLFKKNWSTHRFTANETPLLRFTFAETCAELAIAGVPFESCSFELDMGQPFRTLEDAALFFRVHERQDSGELAENELLARLEKTGSPDFPYYLPANRPVGMIVLDAGDIPDTINSNGGI